MSINGLEYDDEEEDNEDGYTVPDPSKEPTTRMVSQF